ncbi:MAG: TolC family protein [Pseudomonadota bacterium]|nr:TolC family protein [Pseudomonadota bacterium]
MIRLSVVALAAATLAGCASFSADGGMGQVSVLTKERAGQAVHWQRSQADAEVAGARVAELLKKALTPDAAVELALLNNRGLQASFGELGIAEADFVQAGRLRAPTLSLGRLAGGGALEMDRSLMFGVLDLLTMPAATGIARQRFEQAQLQAAATAVGLAAETRRAYFEAVAAQQLIEYYQQVKDAADASADLARRMVIAGNFSKLDQMREQAFYADATSQLARAQQQAVVQRERLVRLLGLSGSQANFKLPERLPELPREVLQPENAEQTALDKRLDVRLAKRDTEATAKSLGLTNVTRFVNALDVGYQTKSQTGTPNERGFQVQVEVPFFDFSGARTARAQAQYMQAVNRTAQVAVNAQSEVRESYAAYRTTYDLAKHYRDEVVPLRQHISNENLLRYNGMLIGVFELIADAREQVSGVTGYVEALRDYWVADTNLQMALTGGSPGPNPMTSAGAAPMASSSGQ